MAEDVRCEIIGLIWTEYEGFDLGFGAVLLHEAELIPRVPELCTDR